MLEEARNDLLEDAAQGNITREHHFKDYLANLEEIGILWDAQRILEAHYEEREED